MKDIVTGIVIDASVALAWCFPDEASDYADRVLVALEDVTAMVPVIWSVEIATALLVGERRKRIRQPEVRRFVELLKGLSILENGQPFADALSNILPLGAGARSIGLRRGVPGCGCPPRSAARHSRWRPTKSVSRRRHQDF